MISKISKLNHPHSNNFKRQMLIHEIKEEGFEKNEAWYQFGCGILKMVGPKK